MSPPHAPTRAPTDYVSIQARDAGKAPERAAILNVRQAEHLGDLQHNRFVLWFGHDQQQAISILDYWKRRTAPIHS
jgi:hypothetical protein